MVAQLCLLGARAGPGRSGAEALPAVRAQGQRKLAMSSSHHWVQGDWSSELARLLPASSGTFPGAPGRRGEGGCRNTRASVLVADAFLTGLQGNVRGWGRPQVPHGRRRGGAGCVVLGERGRMRPGSGSPHPRACPPELGRRPGDLPRAHVSLVTRGADPGQTWQRLRGVWGEVGGTARTGSFWAQAARGLRAREGGATGRRGVKQPQLRLNSLGQTPQGSPGDKASQGATHASCTLHRGPHCPARCFFRAAGLAPG